MGQDPHNLQLTLLLRLKITTGLTMTMDLDPHSAIQPSEFEPRKLDHLQSMLLSIKVHHMLNYDYGTSPTFSDLSSDG